MGFIRGSARRLRLLLVSGMLLCLLAAMPAGAQTPYDDILVAQGLRHLQAENVDEALVDLLTAWEKGTKTAEKAYYLGIAYFRLTQYDRAVDFMTRAVELDPTFQEARLQLAAIHLALDRPGEAQPLLEELAAAGYKPTHTAMLLGQVALRQKRYDAAAGYFREAAADPMLAQQAKLQEGLALSYLDRHTEARWALEQAISLNPTSREAGFAQRYVDALRRRQQEVQHWHLRVGVSFDYDSNVSISPGDPAAAKIIPTGKGDVVFTQLGNIEYDFFPTKPYSLVASYNLFMTWHHRLTLYDVISHTFGLTPSYRLAQGTFWLPFRYNYTDLDSNKYWTAFTLTPTYLHMVKPNLGLETGLKLARNYYWWLQPFPEENRSSRNLGGNLGMYYFFKRQQGFIQARFSYEYNQAAGNNWTSSMYSLLFNVLYPVTETLRLNPSVELISQPFDHRWFDGLEYQAKRRDKIMVAGLQVLYRIYKGFDLNLHYYYVRDDSNLPLYDYDRHITGLLIEYRY